MRKSSPREAPMFVAVQHTIQDPEAFWGKAGEIVPNLPNHVKLHQCFPNKNGTRGICIWEGESVGAIRSYLDAQVGHVSSNDYFEVENKDAIALPSAIQSSQKSNRSSVDTSTRSSSQPSAPPA
ncbi:MAG: hypothetical protein ABR585_13065 [Gemmatimonadaceae bacterium]